MKEPIDLHKEAMDMLMVTSRTFFIPISYLPSGLQEAVAAAYLCMRAIDEIEDHANLPSDVKINLLRSVSQLLQKDEEHVDCSDVFRPYKSLLPEVTLRLGDWIKLCPPSITAKIRSASSTMARGMAEWVSKDWRITNEDDLDQYTYYVAGLVGLMLTDIWKWYEDIDADRELAVAFGRGLQAVNIIRNRAEDLSRGVNFYPDGWGLEEMFQYARRNLALADTYSAGLKPGPVLTFCKIPLMLAHGTLDCLAAGETKLSRAAVEDLVSRVVGGS